MSRDPGAQRHDEDYDSDEDEANDDADDDGGDDDDDDDGWMDARSLAPAGTAAAADGFDFQLSPPSQTRTGSGWPDWP
eukprot:1746358-Pyramimonas_sp.AAC.1